VHELGIARSIVAIAAEAARGRRVHCVTLEIGKLSGVMAEAVAFCFPLAAEGTSVAGARLEIVEIPGRGRCGACGVEFETATLFGPCACGSHRVTRLQGEELNVKTLELEEETA
jgi:hydrogenase nickel incorporation protein HypA/HybF